MTRKIMWILKALLLSYMVTIFLLLLLTLALYKLEISERLVSDGIAAIYVLSTLAGGIYIGKMARKRRFLWGISLGIIYFLLLLLITLGIYGSLNTDLQVLLSTAAIAVTGGMVGGMIS